MKTILVDVINTLIIKGKGIDENIFELLEQCPNRKIIVSNANNEEITALGLTNLPYELFTLKHNPNKSNPEYYRLFLKHFNFNVDDLIYFEHNLEAVKSAKSIGITTYHYDPALKNLPLLKPFLDQNSRLKT